MPEDIEKSRILALSMQVTESGSVRVDLVGGTLDLEPINLILPNVITLNVATSLKAHVHIETISEAVIKIESTDYNKIYEYPLSDMTPENLYYSDYFAEMSFVLQIVSLFDFENGLHIKLSSGAPAGSGLGGSSAMGVTLFKALSRLFHQEFSVQDIVKRVKSVEGRILNQGIPGYQDYFPALMGGVLALKGEARGIVCEQIFSLKLKSFLEDHITLIYSGLSRSSGINNWQVYKAFFDKDENVRQGLAEIADISMKTYQAIKNKNYLEILDLIGQEGHARKALSKSIVPENVSEFYEQLKSNNQVIGLKMCGAGGGGCFILTHLPSQKEAILQQIAKTSFKVLDFKIEQPIQ